jgi:hemerythrin
MQDRNTKFPTRAAEREILDREHADIRRQYIELDDAILHGQGSTRILEAARTLVQYMLLYFSHEERFRKKFSLPAPEEERQAWKNSVAELLKIESGLRQLEVYAALRMRGFCRGWMQQNPLPEVALAETSTVELAVIPGAQETEQERKRA